MKKTAFLTHCENATLIGETLARAVIDNFGGWSDFRATAPDVARHGIQGGFGNWICCADTVKFAEDNRGGILAYARQMAEDLGEPGAYSLIAGFNCLHGMTADSVADAIHSPEDEGDYAQVMNALAWFIAEEVCRTYIDQLDY